MLISVQLVDQYVDEYLANSIGEWVALILMILKLLKGIFVIWCKTGGGFCTPLPVPK